jgi:hypothetical protein
MCKSTQTMKTNSLCKNVMSKYQPTKVTPLYDKVVVLEVATHGRNCYVTSKVSILHLWCHHRISIRQRKYVHSK